MNRAEIGKGFAWTAALGLITRFFVPLVTAILIPRFIGPEQVGLFGTLGLVFSFGELLRDFGLASCYIADRNLTPDRAKAYRGLSVLSGGILALIVLISAPFLAVALNEPRTAPGLAWISLCIFLGGFAAIPLADLSKSGRFRDAGLAEAIPAIVGAVVALLMVARGFGYESLLAFTVLKSLGTNVLVARFTGIGTPAFVSTEVRSILRSAAVIFLGVAAGMGYSLLGNFLVLRMLGTTPFGLYQQAYNWAVRPSDLVLGPLSRTLFVAFSSRELASDALRNTFGRALKASMLLAVPIYIFLGTFAEPIVLLLLKEQFRGSIAPFQVLCLYFGARSVGNIAGNALVSIGRAGQTVRAWFFGYVMMGVVFAANWGNLTLERSAWALTAGALAVYGVTTLFAIQKIPISKEMTRQLGLVVLVLVGFAAVSIAIKLSFPSLYLGLLFGCLLLPFAHLLLIGTVFAKSPTRYLSPQGLKRLWREI